MPTTIWTHNFDGFTNPKSDSDDFDAKNLDVTLDVNELPVKDYNINKHLKKTNKHQMHQIWY